jgi:hypothetical protein
MEKSISDIMVHVDEDLSAEQQCRLEDFVRHDNGVVSAGFSLKAQHLLMVAYDSDETNAGDILMHIRDKGLHAEIVSL